MLSPALPQPLLQLLIPLGAALLALTGALAAACFVKVYGVVFLGQWRGHQQPSNIREVGWSMRLGMLLAALSCLGLGVMPTSVIRWLDSIPEQLIGARIAESASGFGWMWLTPVTAERASYSGPIVLIGIFAVVAVTWLLLHVHHSQISRMPIWDCGFAKLTPRMQYTATSFAMPIRRVLGFFFAVREQLTLVSPINHPFTPQRLQYRLRVRDRFWNWLYQPQSTAAYWVGRQFGRLQHGQIRVYLLYSFVTLLVLLVFLG